MALALIVGLLGVGIYFASNVSFSMLNLSNQYASAISDQQHSIFLIAGEALLSINNPGVIYQGTGIYLSLFFVFGAGLMISIIMLRSLVFSRWTAISGILAKSFGLGYFIALIFVPTLYFVSPSILAVFLIIWYILIARKLFELGKNNQL